MIVLHIGLVFHVSSSMFPLFMFHVHCFRFPCFMVSLSCFRILNLESWIPNLESCILIYTSISFFHVFIFHVSSTCSKSTRCNASTFAVFAGSMLSFSCFMFSGFMFHVLIFNFAWSVFLFFIFSSCAFPSFWFHVPCSHFWFSCSMFSFLICHVPCFYFFMFPCFNFPCLMLLFSCSHGVMLHAFIFRVSCFLVSFFMLSFYMFHVPCHISYFHFSCFHFSVFVLHVFSCHDSVFIFYLSCFYFHVFNFLEIASRVTKWPPGAPKSPQHDLPELQNGPKLSPEAPGWNCTPVRISLPGASRRQKLIFNDPMQRFERPWWPPSPSQPPAPGPRATTLQ